MDFIKKNYEKVLLGVVLLGLVLGAVLLILMIPGERRALDEKRGEIIRKQAKPLADLDSGRVTFLLERYGRGLNLDLTTSNRVFNPVQWQRKADNTLLKVAMGNEVGPEAVVVTKITPLYLNITLDSVDTIGGKLYYVISVEKQAAAKSTQRGRKPFSAQPNVKTESFVIREVHGDPANPTDLVLDLTEGGDRITLARDKPFKRVDGYMADFKYPPDNKTWLNQRVGAGSAGTPLITIAGEQYIVVAISKNEVVLSAKLNNKKTPRPYNPAP